MAKTVTTLNFEQALKAYAELQAAAEKFKSAVHVFASKYDADTVGVVEMAEQIEDWMFEVEADIESTFGEEEE